MIRRRTSLLALASVALLCGHAAMAEGVRVGGHVSSQLQLGLDGCFGDGDCRYLDLRNTNVVGLPLVEVLDAIAALGGPRL